MPKKTSSKKNTKRQRTAHSSTEKKKRLTVSTNQKKKKGVSKRWLSVKNLLVELMLTLFLFSLLLIPTFQYLIVVPQIKGYGMSPTLQNGKRTLVYRHGEIKRFSMIYFKVPERSDGLTNIRRVVGLPGERLTYRDDVLYIDGEEKAERFLAEQLLDAKDNSYTLTEDFSVESIMRDGTDTIPEDHYLVLGDNRTFSVDSRSYGLVSEKDIIGTIELTF